MKTGWPMTKLGNVAEFRNGINYSKDNAGIGIKVIGVGDFQNYTFPRFDTLSQINPEGVVSDDDYLRENDIIFVRSNGNKKLVGRSLLIKGINEKVTFSGFTIRLRFTSNELLPIFYAYLFQSSLVRHALSHKGGGTNISNLNQQILKNLNVPVPRLEEQRKIAEILGTWDEAIAQVAQLIAALQQRKKGLMQRLLTGQVRFPEFEGKRLWSTYKIGQLLKLINRPVKWNDDEMYQLISIRRRSEGIFLREQRQGKDIKTKNLYITRKGDFLISRMQVVHGATALTTEEFDGMNISGSYSALVAKKPDIMSTEYFNWLSKTPEMYHKAFLSSYGVHIEKMTFNLKDYLKQTIKIPSSLEEQRKIVLVLETCDEEIGLLQQKRAALQQQKKGLMQRLLTGQIRVNTGHFPGNSEFPGKS
ncbi:MAG: restriction endonuclease subunit S [Ardenticatenaceae bacterium]|nr:restriction endonuclease subunit S [Ardenticatenaceae bacterium]